ncbi:MAG: hypothetical protein COA94_02050 [Rickettsiales bacterium]|nr:MAG: hypothetical protein COA94_02050 [Rickettsiales bacterium]
MSGYVLYIDGMVGSGKTSLCKRIKAFLVSEESQCKLFSRPINTKLLNLFISNPKNYAFALELSCLTNNRNVRENALSFASEGGIAIVDRSVYGDIACATLQYGSGNISTNEWAICVDTFEGIKEIEVPNEIEELYVYLNTNTTDALNNIYNRGIDSERKYNAVYLERFGPIYFEVTKNIKVHKTGEIPMNFEEVRRLLRSFGIPSN